MNEAADLSFENILLSPPLRFEVGPEKTVFTVHAYLVTRFSATFDRALEGDWKEAVEGVYPLKDIDKDTFVRFCQFLYTGDYPAVVVEECAKAEDVVEDTPDADVPVVEEEWTGTETIAPQIFTWDFSNRVEVEMDFKSSKKGKKAAKQVIPTKEQKLWNIFKRMHFQLPEGRPQSETTVCNRYAEMYSYHLRLYVFAEKYGIAPLAQLCLSHLHQALLSTELVPERVSDIVELAKYSYENTARQADGLRSLVACYVACHAKSIIQSQRFRSLLAECGELGRDIMIKQLETE